MRFTGAAPTTIRVQALIGPRLEALVEVIERVETATIVLLHPDAALRFSRVVLLVRLFVHLDEKVERYDSSCILSESQNVGVLRHLGVHIVSDRLAHEILLILLDDLILKVLRALHVLDCAPVVLLRLHGELGANDHVARAGATHIVLSFEELSHGMQIEEGLVAEIQLRTRMADEQDLCHRVKVEE